ncbi:major facilitator superfamily domain-containing protein 6 [Chelonus insularis]|uniref:major facilitator superfamily domain-containing protein 6 n=1 Tax=Chelonus insularis TaxID=460826 RepID=UPI00158F4291|nr:major facilitator superfamily domain-containing protein 6 [Chelonus insularis]
MSQRFNSKLLPMKAHYFLYNAGIAPIVPFLPTIAKQLGFSSFLVGKIYMILPISGLIAKPLFGILADKYKLHKTLLLTFEVILTIAFFSIYFIPEIHEPVGKVDLTCEGVAFLEVCSSKTFSDESIRGVINDNNNNVQCKISCDVLSQHNTSSYNVLCHEWGVSQFCKFTNTSILDDSRFDFTAVFNMSDDLKVKNCVDIRVRNAIFDNTNTTYRPKCEKLFATTCTMSCPGVKQMEKLLKEIDISKESQTSTYQFHLFLWAAVISWVGMAVIVIIADAICMGLLSDDRKKDYGKQKMWGCIGFGIFNIAAGYLVDIFSQGDENKNYSCIFYIMLIFMIFDMIVSLTLNGESADEFEEYLSVFWELGPLGREGRVLVFIFWCIGAGMCTGVVWNFLFWYTEELVTADQKDWLKTLQGLMTGVQCFLGELPFNFISGQILKKLGHLNVMSLVLIIYAIRFMAYSLIKNPWLFLGVEILHGPTLGLSWPTMVAYGDKIAPSGTRATMQGLVGAVFEGIGVSTGSIICGYLIDTYGGEATFRTFSIGALVWLSIYWIFQVLLRQAKAYPLHQGHSHLASYATPNEAILMTMSQELQTY